MDRLPWLLVVISLLATALAASGCAVRFRMQLVDPNSPEQRLRRMARLLELPSFRDEGGETALPQPSPPDYLPAPPVNAKDGHGSWGVDDWGVATDGGVTELAQIPPGQSLPVDRPAWPVDRLDATGGSLDAKPPPERPLGAAASGPLVRATPPRGLMTWARRNARRVWADRALWRTMPDGAPTDACHVPHALGAAAEGTKAHLPRYLRFEYVELLGTGAYGAAHLLREPSTAEAVVCKVVKLPNSRGRDNIRVNGRQARRDHSAAAAAAASSPAMAELLSEVRILADLAHPHIVGFRASFVQGVSGPTARDAASSQRPSLRLLCR